MYRDLGFLRVWGALGDRARGASYAYLIYPHKPIVAYLAQTRRLLSEYCVEFPDDTRPYGSALLPDSDDVLAKWMALTGDERRLISTANMHLPGRQVDVHAIVFDATGNGIYGPAGNGLMYPAGSLSGAGTVDGVAVQCLTAALQLASRRGRTLRDKDLQDVNALSRRFGLPRPT